MFLNTLNLLQKQAKKEVLDLAELEKQIIEDTFTNVNTANIVKENNDLEGMLAGIFTEEFGETDPLEYGDYHKLVAAFIPAINWSKIVRHLRSVVNSLYNPPRLFGMYSLDNLQVLVAQARLSGGMDEMLGNYMDTTFIINDLIAYIKEKEL